MRVVIDENRPCLHDIRYVGSKLRRNELALRDLVNRLLMFNVDADGDLIGVFPTYLLQPNAHRAVTGVSYA